MRVTPLNLAIVAGVAVGGVAAFWVWRKGLAGAAGAAGTAAVDALGGITAGAVGAIGAGVGLPLPSETTTDPAVARWIIDNHGHLAASKWAGAPAYLRALTMDSGSGSPPPAGSAAAQGLPPLASYDETERLLRRYPGEVPATNYDGYYGIGNSDVPYFAP